MLITSASTYNKNGSYNSTCTATAAASMNTNNQKWRTNESNMCDDDDNDDNDDEDDGTQQVDDAKCTIGESNEEKNTE